MLERFTLYVLRLRELLAALDRSLEGAALCYLEYLWARRAAIPVIHPWFAAAYQQFAALEIY